MDHNFGNSKNILLASSSYITLQKQLDHPRKFLIDIQNIHYNECFKWFLVRCINPTNCHPEIAAKADKYYSETENSSKNRRHLQKRRTNTSNVCIEKYCIENMLILH